MASSERETRRVGPLRRLVVIILCVVALSLASKIDGLGGVALGGILLGFAVAIIEDD